MSQFTLTGVQVTFDDLLGEDNTVAVAPTTLAITMPDGQSTFSYSLLPQQPGDDFIPVDLQIADIATTLDGVTFGDTGPTEVSVFEVVWGGGNRSVVLDLFFDQGDTIGIDHFFPIGGTPLPAINTVADFQAFEQSITGFNVPTGAFAPGQDIALESLAGVVVDDTPIGGGDADGFPVDFGFGLADPAAAGQIQNFVPGDGSVTIENATYTGAPEAIRLLPDGHTIDGPGAQDVSIGRGIFLTSGGGPGTSNTQTGFSVSRSTAGDADLDAAAEAAFGGAGTTRDAAVVEFTFQNAPSLGFDTVSFDVVFGSDEFPEFSNSTFVDIAAVFVNDVNYALFNGQQNQPLSVIDANISVGNFLDNQGEQWATEYDGFSPRLTILAPVVAGTNTMKIGVADTGDTILDSGLFISNMKLLSGGGSGVFTPVVGTSGDDTLQGSDAPELFTVTAGNNKILPGLGNDVMNLGFGSDEILGSLEDLNGDLVNIFGTGDLLTILGQVLDPSQIKVTQGSAIIDIDSDNNGTSDSTVKLSGEFQNADLVLSNEGGNTTLAFNGAQLDGDTGADDLQGTSLNDRLRGFAGNDTLNGSDGADTLNGGDGDDEIFGGDTAADLRDVVFGGAGNDMVDGGAGNDDINGMDGNDTLVGGFGEDTVVGGDGNDAISGGAFSDLLFGNAGDDFINGAFGSDRVNGGAGADKFFHVGILDHGSDWIQDFSHAEGDVLLFGNAGATADQFQINFANTENAGDAAVQEAFVIYKPTEQIIWALVDGGAQTSINLQITGSTDTFDLMA
ncbi:hypothetical protein ABIE69_002093 [Rhodobacteraceae bacterium MBR-64]